MDCQSSDVSAPFRRFKTIDQGSASNVRLEHNQNFSKIFKKTLDFIRIIVYNIQALSGCSADGSVLGSGPRGRGFKSRHSDHLLKVLFINENVDK